MIEAFWRDGRLTCKMKKGAIKQRDWDHAIEVVQRFETISGVRLNVAKSLIKPTGFQEPPQWLRETGCKLALEGEVFTYLGCPIGVGLTEEQVKALKMRFLTQILEDDPLDWVEAAKAIIGWNG
ncbi:hypothetical protein R1sor_004419 [Riccia sorocarpa]|uniref:Uncharacterized protein n=1 Tax=Riccia sorocarpa TaxID=122646 RepID=A0ABD3HGM6_9MARC